MRKYYQNILKNVFYKHLIKERNRLNLTQEKMADILEMDTRNFVNLDNGKNCCNALTLTLFLIYCSDNPIAFLNELKTEYEDNATKEFEKEAATYRRKIPIKEILLHESDDSIYPLCPRCKTPIENDYTPYCGNCGQKIEWKNWEKSPIVSSY